MSFAGRRLYRSRRQRMLGGVCGGLGEYFGIDPVIIRLAWVFFCLAWGAGILFYLIAWLIIPPSPGYVEVQSVPSNTPPSPTSAYPPSPSGNPGMVTVMLALLGVVLVISGISALFSTILQPLSIYVLPAVLIFAGFIVVVVVLILMRR